MLPRNKNYLTIEEVILDIDSSKEVGRISELSEDLKIEKVGGLLWRMIEAVGIREMPGKDLLNDLLAYISYRCRFMYPEEIQMAFYLYIMGRLGEKEEHYNKVSIQYIEIIMRRYDNLKRRLNADFIKQSTKERLPTPEEVRKGEIYTAKKALEMLDGKLDPGLIPMSYFVGIVGNMLWRFKELKLDKETCERCDKEAYAPALEEAIHDAKIASRGVPIATDLIKPGGHLIIKHSRKKKLELVFQSIRERKIDLKSLLEKELNIKLDDE